jgi:ADP-ribosylation factor-like protein 6
VQLASYEVTPTVGFSQESFEKGKLRFTVFDMAGGGAYRSLWEAYYRDVDAIIFVVDSGDRIRMAVAKDELDALLAHADVRRGGAPILICANKMDVRGAMEPPDISATLALHRITDRAWQIQASNALTGEGVEAGIAWLATQLNSGSGGGGSGAGKPKAAPAPAPAAAASGGGGGGGGGAGAAAGGAGAAP